MRDRVTVSMRPLSGTLTISLSHDRWDGTASALTVTFMTPTKITNYVRMEQFWLQLCGRVFDGDQDDGAGWTQQLLNATESQ